MYLLNDTTTGDEDFKKFFLQKPRASKKKKKKGIRLQRQLQYIGRLQPEEEYTLHGRK